MEKYSYEPLNPDRPAIRLLHLHPGGNNSEISCSLSQAELNQRNDTISYEALSYTWGLPDLFERIIVDGCYLNVTYNLHSVLQQLRYSDVDRILWIDAICIDQENKKERGHQVEQMSKIYSEAERVIFWLGLGTLETDILMESLQLLQRESINYNLGGWSLQDNRWKNLWASMELKFGRSHNDFRTLQCQGLRELLARPWFRRVWILQEVALAKAGIMICGRKSVSARLFGLIPLFLEIKPNTHCQSVLNIMPSPWRKTSWRNKSPDLRTLLLNFGDSEATESQDLVYALRGMSSDAAEKNGIIPDYDKSEEVLVREVVQFVERCELEVLASRTAKKPPRTIRDMIKFLRALDFDRCLSLARRSLPHDMEMHLEKTKFSANQDVFTEAVAYDKTGEVVELLIRFRREEFILSHTVLLAAANNPNGAKGVFEALLRYQGDKIKIPDGVLATAAGNELCGGGIFQALLHYQVDKINVSNNVLGRAVGNKKCGNVIIEALLRCKGDQIEISDGVLITAARNELWGGEIFEALLRYQGDQIKISDEVLLTAAKNKGCGNAIFKALFHYQGDPIKISDKVLIAAARNQQYGDVIFEALFRYQGHEIEISDEVLEAATRGIQCGDTMSTLRFHPEYESMGLLRVAAANIGCGDKVLNTLLSHHPDLANVSEEIAITAAKNEGCGDKVMDILLSYHPDLAVFSERVFIAAAKNMRCGDRVINTVLCHHPSLAIISQRATVGFQKYSYKRHFTPKPMLFDS